MEGIEGLLADFGVRPQGKAAPMASARSSRAPAAAGAGAGSAWPNPKSTPAPSFTNGLFGAPPAASASFDSLFGSSFNAPTSTSTTTSSAAAAAATVYDDDDIFGAVPWLRPSFSPTSSAARYDGSDDVFGGGRVAAAGPAFDDVFSTNRSAPPPPSSYDDILGGFGVKPQAGERRSVVVEDDDLLGGFGRNPHAEAEKKPAVVEEVNGGGGFDDLIPGFAGSSPPRNRKIIDDNKNEPAVRTSKSTASIVDDPFVVLETNSASGSTYQSPGGFTDPLEHLGNSESSKGKNVDNTTDNDSLHDDSKSDPLFTSEFNGDTKDMNPPSKDRDSNPLHSSMNENSARRSSIEDLGDVMPTSQSARYSDIYVDGMSSERLTTNGMGDQSPRSTESEDDVWLTVSEIPLFTLPTSAPPPSRSPPLLKQKLPQAKVNGNDDEYVWRSNRNHSHYRDFPDQAEASSLDEMEGFVKDKSQRPSYDNNFFGEAEQSENKSSDREEKERQARLEQEREMKLMEEKKREQRRLEKERELEQQKERERHAMERATKEARERAAAEARAKAEREATQRAQRAAVQRAQQEARERAAAEAKEKAARIAAEARERAASEAKERERAAAERAAAERVQQEARKRAERAAVERAAAEARERQAAAAAAAAAREKQSSADDLESFFGASARANSAPKQRTPTVDSMFDSQPQGRGTANGSQRSTSTSASMRKAPSATNIGNDLSDLFGAPTSSDVFQEVEGESEERRRARLERHQRTRERAAKALAEKNERDMQVQREQAERDRIADTLDFEIRRWAAGKEGNLRALLSTLQFILWPECGWQAVSLTDLITGAAVKKQYRKATLCIHPDKVQQKGATLQQKYTAEKVFDILKEAWNKFNSEELF
ncbi:auxilin-related protein 2-like [Oryza brachyantha]|uniref:auxilin-related protein 2-like n=1 Tax=Oryza brachyantha TaxID=4533 RepID=UPI0003EAC398|nr:auxilin-related protein 2-like [Oryza brachyantha]